MKRILTGMGLFVLIAAGIVVIDAPASEAGPTGGSSLDAWTMTADLLVEGDAAAVASRPIHCNAIFDAWERYEDEQPWLEDDADPAYIEVPWIYNLSGDERSALFQFMQNEGLSGGVLPKDIEFCTTFHDDGWLAADADLIDAVQGASDFVIITASGPIECEFGQVLVASAGYYFSLGSREWMYWYGTDWAGGDTPFIPTTGNVAFRCLDIFDPGAPPISVGDEVPSTQVSINPRNRGLTGLDMWMWYDFANPATHSLGPLSVTISSRGQAWTLTAEAWVDQVMWDVDCTAACTYRGPLDGFDMSGYEYVLDLDDTPRQPATNYWAGEEGDDLGAFEHVYTELGDRTVSTATVWRGFYTHLGIDTAYDPVVVADEWTFPVVSIRTELIERP